MAIHSVNISSFIEQAKTLPVLDVRSPGEFNHAHIPGALSFPIFTDEERKVIGTAYKQLSREEAIKIGLDYFGPKMRKMVEAAEQISKEARSEKKILLHCWRGGLRSSAVAWLLDFYGFEVRLLEGGYKAYRQWAIGHWNDPVTFRVLAGNTGAAKTEVLHALQEMAEPVIDLESLAQHKGSAFGGLGQPPQPTQEMFENRLATALSYLRAANGSKAIWVEDESQRIGDLNIPVDFFRRLHSPDVPVLFLDVPFEQRLMCIVSGYGKHTTESLINAIIRIKKRLGPLETKTAIAHLIEGDVPGCFRILLAYYDKHYNCAAATKRFEVQHHTPWEIAAAIKDIL